MSEALANGSAAEVQADYDACVTYGNGQALQGLPQWLRTSRLPIPALSQRAAEILMFDARVNGRRLSFRDAIAEVAPYIDGDDLGGPDLRAAHERTKASGTPVERFTLLDDATLENLPALVWLLHRIIPRRALFMIFGQPGSMKTFLALLLAFHIALGREFHGRAVERGPVIFVAAEGAAGLSLRVRALREQLALDVQEFTPGLRVVGGPILTAVLDADGARMVAPRRIEVSDYGLAAA